MVALRRERRDLPSGPVRAAAVDAYVAQLAGAEGVVARAKDPGRVRRRTLRALSVEESALPGEARLTGGEERRIVAAIEAARAACYRESAPLSGAALSA